MQSLEGRPEISYPCSWTYRIICMDEQALRGAVIEIVAGAQHTLSVIGTSDSGRYHRLELIVFVQDEAQRDAIFVALGRAPSVRYVL